MSTNGIVLHQHVIKFEVICLHHLTRLENQTILVLVNTILLSWYHTDDSYPAMLLTVQYSVDYMLTCMLSHLSSSI